MEAGISEKAEQMSAAELLAQLAERDAADYAHMVAETYDQIEQVYDAAAAIWQPRVLSSASANRP